jgi:hypothetical protein
MNTDNAVKSRGRNKVYRAFCHHSAKLYPPEHYRFTHEITHLSGVEKSIIRVGAYSYIRVHIP